MLQQLAQSLGRRAEAASEGDETSADSSVTPGETRETPETPELDEAAREVLDGVRFGEQLDEEGLAALERAEAVLQRTLAEHDHHFPRPEPRPDDASADEAQQRLESATRTLGRIRFGDQLSHQELGEIQDAEAVLQASLDEVDRRPVDAAEHSHALLAGLPTLLSLAASTPPSEPVAPDAQTWDFDEMHWLTEDEADWSIECVWSE